MDSRSPPPPPPPSDPSAASNGRPEEEIKNGSARPSIVPPYWQSHQRQASYASVVSIGKPPPITLEDHTEESHDISSPLWAKVVSIDHHVVVSGSVSGIGDYVVWMCNVDTLNVCPSVSSSVQNLIFHSRELPFSELYWQ